MKNILIFNFFLLIISGPQLNLKSNSHNFGTIYQDSSALHYFTFKNTGDSPLIISGVRTMCGCTKAEFPKYPILSGQTDSIAIAYDTHKLTSFTMWAFIQSNSVGKPEIKLEVKGKIIAKPTEK